MNVTGLDGKQYKLNLTKYVRAKPACSKPHLEARTLLKDIFPVSKILEEVRLPGSGKTDLVADFMLPHEKMVIEVHGEQHFTHTQFFHPTVHDFANAKRRDSNKEQWCEINGFEYIVLDHKESKDDWRKRITS